MANKAIRESEAFKSFEMISQDEAFVRKTMGVVILLVTCYMVIYQLTFLSKPSYCSLLMAIGIYSYY